MAKQSGRITLRVTPEVHQELADIAEGLGLDINGVLNLMIRDSYSAYKSKARLLTHMRAARERAKTREAAERFEELESLYKRSRIEEFETHLHSFESVLHRLRHEEAEMVKLFPG